MSEKNSTESAEGETRKPEKVETRKAPKEKKLLRCTGPSFCENVWDAEEEGEFCSQCGSKGEPVE